MFLERVWKLRAAVRSAKPTICSERAVLVTEYFKNPENMMKPIIIRKAEALRHILRNRTACIYEDELLVGCFSSKRVGGAVFPELYGVTVLQDLFNFKTRAINPLNIETKDIQALVFNVFPYWLTRFLTLKAFPVPKALRFVADQLGGKRYLINETGGISHFVPDYATLLDALNRDFEGYEHIRGYLLKAPKFGNNDPRADRFAREVMTILSDTLAEYTNTRGGKYWAGFYSGTAHPRVF